MKHLKIYEELNEPIYYDKYKEPFFKVGDYVTCVTNDSIYLLYNSTYKVTKIYKIDNKYACDVIGYKKGTGPHEKLLGYNCGCFMTEIEMDIKKYNI
jgi:hypothetical protein